MEPFRMVCINDDGWVWPINNADYSGPKYLEIVTVVYVDPSDGFYRLNGYMNYYDPAEFRPISDCGPAICEWIEETAFKEYQLEEVTKLDA